MKTHIKFLALFALVFSSGMLIAQEETPQADSNTRYAEAVLRIAADPKTFPMGTKEDDWIRISDLLIGPDVLGMAWKETIGTDERENQVEIQTLQAPLQIGGIQLMRIKILVTLTTDQKPAAREFVERYIQKLKSELLKEEQYAMEIYREQCSEYDRRRVEAEQRLVELLNRQNGIGQGRGALDKESVRRRIQEHEKAAIDISMEQAILEKRREIISRQIYEIQEAADRNTHGDTLIETIKQRLDQLESELKVQETAGTKDRDNIAGLQERIIPLQIQLAERNQQVQGQAVEIIRELNHLLRETTVRQEELEIERNVHFGTSPGSIQDSLDYEIFEVKIEAARENLRRAIIQEDEYRQQVDLIQPPAVTYDQIVSGEKAPVNN